MNFPAHLFPDDIYWFANYLYLLALVAALVRAPWRRLVEAEHRHLFLGTTVGLLLLWSMKAGINPGMNFHLLGATLLTLMFGWQLAIISVSLVLVGITFNHGVPWTAFSLNALFMVVFPVFLSQAIYRFSLKFLPHQFFVYVLFDGYLCGAVAMVTTITVSSLLMWSFSHYTAWQLLHLYLPFAPFMAFGEAFFTGMFTAGLALFRPEWIVSFDERLYLKGK